MTDINPEHFLSELDDSYVINGEKTWISNGGTNRCRSQNTYNCTDQTQLAVDTRQQRYAAIAGDVATAEIGFDLAAFNGWKLQRSTVPFFHGGWSLKACGKPLFSWTFCRFSIPYS